ncbi:MAG: hypothetical protein HYV07_14675 [Deltaproteobacteria bacterium]|nr:hypothetical protein [Deltaproteobacteria bacterium]
MRSETSCAPQESLSCPPQEVLWALALEVGSYSAQFAVARHAAGCARCEGILFAQGGLAERAERNLETSTARLSICSYTSELFYEGKLKPHPGLAAQAVVGPTPYAGAGLFFVPVAHDGNQNSSIVKSILVPGVTWVSRNGDAKPLTLEDILIVAPYNAQVSEIAERIPGARIGTVDKFQGQEAPVVIYSMTTSSPEEAPHGMEFLFSRHRLNVATSRARCVCILVGNPELFDLACRTPEQMRMASAFCRYLELARMAETIPASLARPVVAVEEVSG